MSSRVKFISTCLLISSLPFLISCSNKPTEIHVMKNQLAKATISDADGIKSIISQQRIPSGGRYLVYDVDFKFDKAGTNSYDIYIGGMFDVVGTAVHLEITDMKGEKSFLFIRSTPQGYQTGSYRKK